MSNKFFFQNLDKPYWMSWSTSRLLIFYQDNLSLHEIKIPLSLDQHNLDSRISPTLSSRKKNKFFDQDESEKTRIPPKISLNLKISSVYILSLRFLLAWRHPPKFCKPNTIIKKLLSKFIYIHFQSIRRLLHNVLIGFIVVIINVAEVTLQIFFADHAY